MKKRNSIPLAAAMALSLPFLSACPPPLPPDAVYVRTAPPVAQVEVVYASPGPNYVWIGGYQRWDGSAYVWVPGRWEARPHANARWTTGRWVHYSRGWYWHDGHWS